MKYDVIVVGAGFAGSVMARCFAEDEKKVLVIDKRNHMHQLFGYLELEL